MPDPSAMRPRPGNRNTLWLVGLAIAVVVVLALTLVSRGGDGRSGAQVYASSGGLAPAGAASTVPATGRSD